MHTSLNEESLMSLVSFLKFLLCRLFLNNACIEKGDYKGGFMAGLYALFFLVLLAAFSKQRTLALALWVTSLVLCLFMFLHHANDILMIRW